MCGIAGFIDMQGQSTPSMLDSMVATLGHRGPDGNGSKPSSFGQTAIGLGHARLSILDLSSDGQQPMQYKNLTIVFNGEVYNFKEIKQQLESLGHNFETGTDTEVILHAFDEWGHSAVHRCVGMFAFALHDSKTNQLSLFRDRVGVKPLYYYENNGLFLFASELKAMMAHPQFEKNIDTSVLANYFHLGYIPAPGTIFQNCHKLEPGHTLTLNIETFTFKLERYWDVTDYYTAPKLQLDYIEAKEQLKGLFQSAFSYRMVSDVPVGVFLSGGYDSTAVAAVLQSDRTEQLKTFTIGFEEGNNEAPFAKNTAAHLGTDHTEYICTTKEAQELIPQLPYHYDEPFGDSSAIPTTLVSQLARKQVTVALSADGGDEVFCGYGSYFHSAHLNKKLDRIPSFMKSVFSSLSPLSSALYRFSSPDVRHKIQSALRSMSSDPYLQSQALFSAMKQKPASYIQAFFSKEFISSPFPYDMDFSAFHSPMEGIMAADYLSYLPDDILTKVDRATMSTSLEGRDPLLDHRIIEFAARLPLSYKYNGGTHGKRILKDIVYDYVPKDMMDRPKAGFSLPIYRWLRADLSYLVDEYLSDAALAKSGLFDVPFVSKQVSLFKENKLHYSPMIWYLLMFQMWWFEWME